VTVSAAVFHRKNESMLVWPGPQMMKMGGWLHKLKSLVMFA